MIFRRFEPSNFFFHVLYDGKTKLVNRNAKYLKENREYNSAIITKKVSSSNKYYLIKGDNILMEIKLNKKSVLAALLDKQEDASKFADSEKLDLSRPEDIAKLLSHYDQ
jgi:hypothetical protein